MACYANKELYNIMTTASTTISACSENPGKYPNGKTAGASFCMFDNMGFVSFLEATFEFLISITIVKPFLQEKFLLNIQEIFEKNH